MLLALYSLFIAPLEFLLRLVLECAFLLTHSWGWSLVLLSLVVNTAILPLYNWADRCQVQERKMRRDMARHEAMLRECFGGQERFALLSALRRLRGYNWALTLRGGVGPLLQIPFFIAAYHLLAEFSPLRGQPFGLLADLAAPDGLFSLGGFRLNLLPFVMTSVNLASAFAYARNLSRRDESLSYVIALVFLVLLYSAPSSLVLYWTLNNLYSFVKNILQNTTMVRLAGRSARNRIGKDPAMPARRNAPPGTFADYAAYLVRLASSTFWAGLLCWLWTCSFAFSGGINLLDSGFKAALRHFGCQCVVTAFLASLALFVSVPSVSRRKTASHSLALFGSVVVLFLLQILFLTPSLDVADGRFAFDMWDRRGAFVFVLWLMCVVGMRRYGEAVHAMFLALLPRAAPHRTATLAQLPSPVPDRRDTFFFACLTGGVCALFLWLFIPFSTFFHNVNEFEFGAWELLAKLPPYIAVTFLLLTFLFWGASRLLPWECVRLPGRRTASGGKLTMAHTLSLAFLAGVLIEGTVLSYKLPRLTGEKDLYDSILRLTVDTAIWLNLLIIGIRSWRWLAKRVNVVLCLLVVFSLAALGDAYRGKAEKIDPASYKENVNGLYEVDKFTFYSKLGFSRNDNTIVVMADSFDTLAFEKTLELYPDLLPVFDGFWLFRQNLGAGGHTMTAMPQVFLGKTYDGTVSEKEFVEASLRGEHSMAADALKSGRKVFMHFLHWLIMSSDTEIDANSSYRKIEIKDYIKVLFFRFLPYLGKNIFEDAVNFRDKTMDGYLLSGTDIDTERFNKIIANISHWYEEPVYQFIYFTGVHPPFIKEDIFQTARNFILNLSVVIKGLQDFGLYDQTSIVLMSDHGLEKYDHRYLYPERMGKYRTMYFPLLMVKAAGSTGPMIVREDLTSSIDVRPLLKSFYAQGSNNAVMESFLKTLPDVRYMYIPEEGKLEARGTFSTLSLEKAAQ